MIRRAPSRLRWALWTVGAGALAWAIVRFPWSGVLVALGRADAWLLWIALLVNLSSLVAKGWAWHLLLRQCSASRWRIAQEGNLLGSAVANFSVSLTGEAARVQYVMTHDRLPGEKVVASVAWTRAAEGLAIALFLLVAPCFLRLPPVLRGVQIAAGVALALGIGLVWSRRLLRIRQFVPRPVRSLATALSSLGSPRRLIGPTLFGVVNWGAQWATFHLVLLALRVPVTAAASFTALIVTNLAGLPRISPGNVGLLQASMAGALLPFGVSPNDAVAAGLALQAIQVLPVEGLAVALIGWKGFRQAIAGREKRPLDPSLPEGAAMPSAVPGSRRHSPAPDFMDTGVADIGHRNSASDELAKSPAPTKST